MSSELASFYKRAAVTLWVEDIHTRLYLEELWQSQQIGYLIGGGRDTIQAVTEDAYRSGVPIVFGLCDRDFGRTNVHRWQVMDDSERVYRLPRVEVENYLLDAIALAACKWNTAPRSPTEIDARMQSCVEESAWWLATRRALHGLSRESVDGFPSDPRARHISSLSDAITYVTSSRWATSTVHGMSGKVSSPAIAARLEEEHAAVTASLVDGTWRETCSGKEVFAQVDSYVWTRGRRSDSKAELARAVAIEQVRAGRVPADLDRLRVALLDRLNRSLALLEPR